jgi:hypothetical protein
LQAKGREWADGWGGGGRACGCWREEAARAVGREDEGGLAVEDEDQTARVVAGRRGENKTSHAPSCVCGAVPDPLRVEIKPVLRAWGALSVERRKMPPRTVLHAWGRVGRRGEKVKPLRTDLHAWGAPVVGRGAGDGLGPENRACHWTQHGGRDGG